MARATIARIRASQDQRKNRERKTHREEKTGAKLTEPPDAAAELLPSPDAPSASAAAARTASSVSGAKPRYPALFAEEPVSSQMRPRSRCSVQTC